MCESTVEVFFEWLLDWLSESYYFKLLIFIYSKREL